MGSRACITLRHQFIPYPLSDQFWTRVSQGGSQLERFACAANLSQRWSSSTFSARYIVGESCSSSLLRHEGEILTPSKTAAHCAFRDEEPVVPIELVLVFKFTFRFPGGFLPRWLELMSVVPSCALSFIQLIRGEYMHLSSNHWERQERYLVYMPHVSECIRFLVVVRIKQTLMSKRRGLYVRGRNVIIPTYDEPNQNILLSMRETKGRRCRDRGGYPYLSTACQHNSALA